MEHVFYGKSQYNRKITNDFSVIWNFPPKKGVPYFRNWVYVSSLSALYAAVFIVNLIYTTYLK